MARTPTTRRIILIGGTSHSGKTTVGRAMAEQLNAVLLSTDSLARHPGRPWKPAGEAVPAHVVDYYTHYDLNEQLDAVITHYQHLQQRIESHVHCALAEDTPLVVEGSALLPEHWAERKDPRLHVLWLLTTPTLLRTRIYIESNYAHRNPEQQQLIDAFVQRSIRFDGYLRTGLGRQRA